MIRMNKNESPIKPLDDTQLAQIITSSNFHHYPDEEHDRFRRAYAAYYQNLNMNQICCGNGSDELIQKLMFHMPEGPCLTFNPDFFMYQDYANQTDREIYFIEATEDLTFPLEKVQAEIERIQPSFFIFSNPHNPTGHRFDESYVEALADTMKKINGYLVVDEAYIDFSTPLDIPLQDHVIVMRTLSKAFALAGLRLGVLISTEKTIAMMREIEHPYPLTSLTLAVATQIFENQDDTKAFVEHQRALSQRLRDILNTYAKPHMTVFPSDTNFVLTRGEKAEDLGHYLEEKGFHARFYDPKTEYPMSESVRYSIATDEELDAFEAAVKEWSERHGVSNQS
ncbi:pyridoxal phosphate-dependent aminotransferase [Staphylococcus canis]|uniref:Putative pyridoxal phosphate-dependent acyltransferase n=1 Tax=Staphylococcus canis TaxID=2724942 RepID=A0ABS0T768_9STAP|nr:histidinol-phosphate transaminase [Staphylococcus canis]MBI5974420.1 histidinol-phosphate aminotransferase family protein [Staphylococcus canis]